MNTGGSEGHGGEGMFGLFACRVDAAGAQKFAGKTLPSSSARGTKNISGAAAAMPFSSLRLPAPILQSILEKKKRRQKSQTTEAAAGDNSSWIRLPRMHT